MKQEAADEKYLRSYAQHGDLAEAIHKNVRIGAGLSEQVRALTRVRSLAQGVGPELADIFTDTNITDVLINSTQVWVDKGQGLTHHPMRFSEKDTRRLAIHMAAACGKRLDDASPIVDGTLPSGIRLHAVLPPLSTSGTLISLRTSKPSGMSLATMESSGSIAPLVAHTLNTLVSGRANVIISGATGSGKTTLLAALLARIPHDQRIICIEEVNELHPDHPHVINLCERQANVQGAGAVTLSDLVRAAMRMRPDRMVLGECRGAEVRDVMTALNTGHDGGWATIHANSAFDVPARLYALGALAGMSEAAVSAQAVAAFDAIVHMKRQPTGHQLPRTTGRWVAQIAVLETDRGCLTASVALEADSTGQVRTGPAWEPLMARFGGNICEDAASGVAVEGSDTPTDVQASAPSHLRTPIHAQAKQIRRIEGLRLTPPSRHTRGN